MTEEQAAMMNRLQQLGLTLNDLNIYLDTHLYDNYAMERFAMTADEYKNLADQYDRAYGPLTVTQLDNEAEGWLWAMQDFPWDY